MSEIRVTPWGTRQPLPGDPSAPMHSALWNVATEQAILARIEKTGEDWTAAARHVTDKDIVEHLDVICDDNNFRRLDGSGTGRDPNLIIDGERIQVSFDPKEITQPANGIGHDTPKALDAYNKALTNPTNTDWDQSKKPLLDSYLRDIPNFTTLADDSKAALIEAYGRPGVNTQNLAKFAGSPLFQEHLDPEQQKYLLAHYGVKGMEVITGEVDKLAAGPVNSESVLRLKLLSTPGLGAMTGPQQQQFLERLSRDASFQAAVVTITGQDNFKELSPISQGFALDILRRYSSRKGDGYGEVDRKNRTTVLEKLFSDVLMSPKFKLQEAPPFPQLNDSQTKMIDNFADNKAGDIRAP